MKKQPFPNLIQAVIISLTFIVFSILYFPLSPNSHIFKLNNELLLLIYNLLVSGSTLLFSLIFLRVNKGKLFLSKSSLRKKYIILLVLSSISLMIISSFIASLISTPSEHNTDISNLLEYTGPYTFIYFAILGPIVEELIYRGIILAGMLKNYSSLKAIILSSLLFGFVHLNIMQFITGFFLGCLCGWIYYRTSSLFYCIIMHVSINTSSFVLRLSYNGSISQFSNYFHNHTIFILLIAFTCLTSCILLLNKLFNEEYSLKDKKIVL